MNKSELLRRTYCFATGLLYLSLMSCGDKIPKPTRESDAVDSGSIEGTLAEELKFDDRTMSGFKALLFDQGGDRHRNPSDTSLAAVGLSREAWEMFVRLAGEVESGGDARTQAFDSETMRTNRNLVREKLRSGEMMTSSQEIDEARQALTSDDLLARRNAAAVLAENAIVAVIPDLRKLLGDEDTAIVMKGLEGLARIGTPASAAAEDVASVIFATPPEGTSQSRATRLRETAAGALASMGTAAGPSLRRALASDDQAVVRAVLDGIVTYKLGMPACKERMVELLGSSDRDLRLLVMRALRFTPEAARAANDTVIGILRGEDEELASLATHLLAHLDLSAAADVVDRRVEALLFPPHEDRRKRRSGTMGSGVAPEIVSVLAAVGEPALKSIASRAGRTRELNAAALAITGIVEAHPRLAPMAAPVLENIATRLGRDDIWAAAAILNAVSQPDFQVSATQKERIFERFIENQEIVRVIQAALMMGGAIKGPAANIMGGSDFAEQYKGMFPKLSLGRDIQFMIPALTDRVGSVKSDDLQHLVILASVIGKPAIDVHRAALKRCHNDAELAGTVATSIAMALSGNDELKAALTPDLEELGERYPQVGMMIRIFLQQND